ncbi:MAG: class I SAM-dependent methyltransferase [Myxococcota bacterium]
MTEEMMFAEKTEVPKDFDRIAKSYDLFATMNPWYQDHLLMSAARLRLGPHARILDLCCGTGLSTEALATVYQGAEITGLDASEGMLAQARAKVGPKLATNIRFFHGDAMDPGATVEGPFDGIFMAYGIRNMPDRDLCLERLKELLVPGGRIVFHEFSVADSWKSRALWNAVSYGLIIPGGLLTAGSARIYRYLRKSVTTFDGVLAFEARLRRAGFVHVHTLPSDAWEKGILHSFIAERAK